MASPIEFTTSERYARTLFGFWLYLLTDLVMFGAVFASYLVLRNSTYGGPSAQDLLSLWHGFGVTVLLLTSALFAGLTRVQAFRSKVFGTVLQLAITTALGIWFLGATFSESATILAQGFSWKMSAFLSAFFTLIWLHSFHILAAILWSLLMMFQIALRGITEHTFRRLTMLSFFWKFLALLWTFTFTIVYLMGVGGL